MRGFICTAKGLADSDYHRTGIVGFPCECSFGVTATHNFTAILGCRFSITATTLCTVSKINGERVGYIVAHKCELILQSGECIQMEEQTCTFRLKLRSLKRSCTEGSRRHNYVNRRFAVSRLQIVDKSRSGQFG